MSTQAEPRDSKSGQRQKFAILFIMVTVMLDSAGIGIIMPVMPGLVSELADVDMSDAARWGGFLGVTYALMQFLFGPTIGNLSDRFGRRLVLLVSMAAMAVDYVIMALAPTMLVLFIGRVLAGIAGATISTANAYMADISTAKERAARFGLVGAAFGVGFIVGPAIGGILSEYGSRVPFWAAAILAALNFVLGWFVLKETLPVERRRAFTWARANPVGAFTHLRKFPNLVMLFVIVFIFGMAHWVYPAVWAFYTQLPEGIGMTKAMSGYSLAAFGLASAIVQGLLLRRIMKTLGERWTIIVGFGANLLGFLYLAFASTPTMIFLGIPIIAIGVVTTPALQGIMSNLVPEDSQGELQGAVTSVQSIATIFSPLLMTQLFANFTDGTFDIFFPGAPFFVAACLVALCAWPLRSVLKASR